MGCARTVLINLGGLAMSSIRSRYLVEKAFRVDPRLGGMYGGPRGEIDLRGMTIVQSSWWAAVRLLFLKTTSILQGEAGAHI